MPEVDGKEYPYTEKGIAAAKAAKKKKSAKNEGLAENVSETTKNIGY